MKKEITISRDESVTIERLFSRWTSYMSMLEFFAADGVSKNSELYDKKWNEASDLWIELEKAKRIIEARYKPAGEWDRYEFDFDNEQVIFYKDA